MLLLETPTGFPSQRRRPQHPLSSPPGNLPGLTPLLSLFHQTGLLAVPQTRTSCTPRSLCSCSSVLLEHFLLAYVMLSRNERNIRISAKCHLSFDIPPAPLYEIATLPTTSHHTHSFPVPFPNLIFLYSTCHHHKIYLCFVLC